MLCTAVFYTAISRLHFISRHTSVSTDQNWATVLQCINQISPGPPCQGFILTETLAHQQNMEKCKRACSSSSLIRREFHEYHTKGQICSCRVCILAGHYESVVLYNYFQQVLAGHLACVEEITGWSPCKTLTRHCCQNRQVYIIL